MKNVKQNFTLDLLKLLNSISPPIFIINKDDKIQYFMDGQLK